MEIDGLAQPARRFLAEQRQIADGADTPPVGGCTDLLDHVGDDLDQRGELVGIALQVLGGQQVDGGHLDARVLAPAQHFGDLGRTHAIADADVVVPGVAGPTAVSVAQHRDMARQL